MSKHKPIIAWTPSLYDRLSKQYDRFADWFFPISDQGREKVISGLRSGLILDVACGTGTLLKKAQQTGLHCIGIDISRGMLLEAKRKLPAADVVQASFYAMPFADDQFNYVVETNAVSGVDINANPVLLEMLRVCKYKGELRFADYGKSGREGLWIRILVMLGILFGDYPHDYRELLSALGYDCQIESLGWGGMYQYIKLVKQHQVS